MNLNNHLNFVQMLHIGLQGGDMLKANAPCVRQPSVVPVSHANVVHCGSFVANSKDFPEASFGVVACLNPLVVLWQNGDFKYHSFTFELFVVPQDFVDAKYNKDLMTAASPTLIAEVLQFIDPAQQYGPEKIQAIKHVREVLGISLKAAKLFVEAIKRGEYPKPPTTAKLCIYVSGDVDVEVKKV